MTKLYGERCSHYRNGERIHLGDVILTETTGRAMWEVAERCPTESTPGALKIGARLIGTEGGELTLFNILDVKFYGRKGITS